MRSESYRLRDLDKVTIPIGFVGENLYTTVKIDCGEVFSVHPDAVPSLAVTPPEGESYPAVVTREGDIVIWRVSASDLIHKGTGEIQLSFTIDGEIIGMTYPANTRVFRSIVPSGSVPPPIANWLVQAGEALQALPQEVQDAVTTVLSAMVGIGETLDPDENVTVSYDAENNTLTIGVPRGADGHDGHDGVDGHTPVITAEKVSKTTTIYVDGTAIATVNDGTDGAGIDDSTVSTESTWSSKKIDDENSALKTEIQSSESLIGFVDTKVDNLYGQFTEDKSENLFNKNDIETGKYFSVNGSGAYTGISTHSDVDISYIKIDGSGNYSSKVATSFFGTYKARFIPIFNKIKGNVGIITGTLDSGDDTICHFAVTDSHIQNGAYYIGLTISVNDVNTAMLVKSSEYPSEYIAYYNNGYDKFDGYVNRGKVVDLLTNNAKSANLFNYNDECAYGKYFSISGGGSYSGLGDSGGARSYYVPISGAGDYSWKNAKKIYGSYVSRFVVLFDSTKTYQEVVTGNVDSSDGTITHFTITDTMINNGAKYLGYTVYTTDLGTAMIVKSDTYPSEYIPYREAFVNLKDEIKVPPEALMDHGTNPLYGKKVVFDGDSICQDGNCGGWAKIIGSANGMIWENVGISGGTITAGTYSGSTARHWVCRSIDDIHEKFDDLDYLILEGGTNDADKLTDAQIGSIDPSNFSTFDDETFVGALESLFYKATNYYPTAKIGFIVAQRMGYASGARYDSADSPSPRRRRKFFETAIEVCKKWGIPYIDLWEGSPLCPMLECYYDSSMTAEENTEAGKAYTDGQHLTSVGYSIISPKIEAWMKTL